VTEVIDAVNRPVAAPRAPSGGRLTWLDLRSVEPAVKARLVEAALQNGLDGVLDDDPAALASLSPAITRIGVAASLERVAAHAEHADVVLVAPDHLEAALDATVDRDVEIGLTVEVVDSRTVELASAAARSERWTLLRFKDPTKIPLEIVIAASDNVDGHIVTVCADVEEARIVMGVLEKGPHGIAITTRTAADVHEVSAARQSWTSRIDLCELEVAGIRNLGMGERACVDTCSLFDTDEGILVGSFARGLVLACSETHPLPYMPTRPFRVNAGAVHSYVLTRPERTNYLSELTSGHQVLGVGVDGRTRPLTVGRMKVERRPLIGIDLFHGGGGKVGVIMQNDWHVRILGPGGRVHNVTELRPGETLLGFVSPAQRHVGMAVSELCEER
jgi:3-amino-4-hydroxybenzoic acid synthase